MNDFQKDSPDVTCVSQGRNIGHDYFGYGVVSIDLSDLSLISSQHDMSSGCEEHCLCSDIERDLSSILHDAGITHDILDDSWTCTKADQVSDGGSTHSAENNLESALTRLDAICDWLENKPALYNSPVPVAKKRCRAHDIIAKCSVSSLPQNMCDSISVIYPTILDSNKQRKTTAQTKSPAPTQTSNRKAGPSIRTLFRKRLVKICTLFRKKERKH